jgi:hypothetical protein
MWHSHPQSIERSRLLSVNRIPKLLSQPKEVGQRASCAAGTSLLLTNPCWEVSFRFSGRWGRSWSSFRSRSGGNSRSWGRDNIRRSGGGSRHRSRTTVGRSCGASTTRRVAAAGSNCTRHAASVGNFITTQVQALLGGPTNLFIAITQCTHQSLRNLVTAAAFVASQLVGNLSRSLITDAFVGVIQSVDKGTHDFWVAATIATTEAAQGCTAFTSIASGLRDINPLSDTTSRL